MHDTEHELRYRRATDQDRSVPGRHDVVIVGAGPVGLVLAIDLARKGHHPIVIERKHGHSDGSRAICWSKRTLEVMARLGLADALVARGVTWQRGKVLAGDRALYEFDLLPEHGHRQPAFINLQQYLFEEICLGEIRRLGIDLRSGHEVVGLARGAEGARLDIATPDGPYAIDARFVLAADGARSTVRQLLGLGFEGQVFNDQFLICDVKLEIDRPTERWFWFDPPFNRGQSALLHRQADNVWRLDFQIGPDADRDEEMRPENVARRVRAMLGETPFTFEWISCYRFQCRRLARFRHGPVLFVGDAAHQVSPFGARGGNSGVQDVDNLGWKLDLVLRGTAPDALIDTYDVERRQAADENITASTRSTDFISPKGPGPTLFRDGVLALARHEPFARRLLNSGRLSTPTIYDGSPLNSPDGVPDGPPSLRPGAPALDAPLDATDGGGYLLDRLDAGFTLLRLGQGSPSKASAGSDGAPLRMLDIGHSPAAHHRYDAEASDRVYLIRPDQHVAARWACLDHASVATALGRALARRAL